MFVFSFSMDCFTTVNLLCLEHGSCSLEDHVDEFLDLVHLTTFPDDYLNTTTCAQLSGECPRGSFADYWHFSTAWYGMVRYGTVHFWGVFHWVLYLVPDTFLVPLRSRFQASRTVTKTWRENSADHWLAGENRHYWTHWTCDTRPSSTALPARFKSAQPAKDRMQLLFKQTHIFASTTK